jgi:hypothetical protein
MKLVKTDIKRLVRNPEGSGLFTTDLHYEVTKAEGELTYTGPKIQPIVWQQVLSFFKWSYDKTKGESQVRLFVNPKLGLWRAWAFPQEASMGLSTRELDNEEKKKQRAELFGKEDADWTAWGTVHHHCDIGAFQSGTDEQDEKSVGGLHITVGDINKAHHSIHCRLYHQGDLYEPDMSKFWDIGDVLKNLPPEIKAFIPAGIEDRVAREQMCIPSTVEFPDQWKENLIEIKQETYQDEYWAGRVPYAYQEKDGDFKWIGGERYQRIKGVYVKAPWQSDPKPKEPEKPIFRRRAPGAEGLSPIDERTEEALEDLLDTFGMYGIEYHEVEQLLADFNQDDNAKIISQVCKDHNVLAEDLLDELRETMQEMEKGSTPSTNGVSDDQNLSDL